MLKIYFAGSIRGGRADADLHKKIIGFLQKDNIVLTAHVRDLSKSKTEHSDAAIYNQDSAWLKAPAPLRLTRERPHQYYSIRPRPRLRILPRDRRSRDARWW